MPKDSQINIRFDQETDRRLAETARKLGLSKSGLVRHFTARFLETVNREGGLRMDLEIDPADGRTEWGEPKTAEAADHEETYRAKKKK